MPTDFKPSHTVEAVRVRMKEIFESGETFWLYRDIESEFGFAPEPGTRGYDIVKSARDKLMRKEGITTRCWQAMPKDQKADVGNAPEEPDALVFLRDAKVVRDRSREGRIRTQAKRIHTEAMRVLKDGRLVGSDANAAALKIMKAEQMAALSERKAIAQNPTEVPNGKAILAELSKVAG